MRHFGTTGWSDFVRGLVDAETASAMSTHLEGCTRCAGTVAALRRTRSLADANAASEPPAGLVRSVKAYFGVQASRLGSPVRERVMRLVGDGEMQPAAVGVRSERYLARRLRYEGSDLLLDLDMTASHRAERLDLVGEFVSQTSGPVPGAPAFLLAGGRVVSQTSTDGFGAFALSADTDSEARLCLVLEDGATVSIDLPGHQGSVEV